MRTIRYAPNGWRQKFYALRYHAAGALRMRRKPKKVFLTFAAGPDYTVDYLVRDVRALGNLMKSKAMVPKIWANIFGVGMENSCTKF